MKKYHKVRNHRSNKDTIRRHKTNDARFTELGCAAWKTRKNLAVNTNSWNRKEPKKSRPAFLGFAPWLPSKSCNTKRRTKKRHVNRNGMNRPRSKYNPSRDSSLNGNGSRMNRRKFKPNPLRNSSIWPTQYRPTGSYQPSTMKRNRRKVFRQRNRRRTKPH